MKASRWCDESREMFIQLNALHPVLSKPFRWVLLHKSISGEGKKNRLAYSSVCVCVFLSASLHLLVVSLAQEGEIWPNIPVQLNIVFRPEEARLYQETIYCDVTGEFDSSSLQFQVFEDFSVCPPHWLQA